VKVANAPKQARLRVVVGSGRTARTVGRKGSSLLLPAKLSAPSRRIRVRVFDATGKRIASVSVRAPKRAVASNR
jgi:hypothetical protein